MPMGVAGGRQVADDQPEAALIIKMKASAAGQSEEAIPPPAHLTIARELG